MCNFTFRIKTNMFQQKCLAVDQDLEQESYTPFTFSLTYTAGTLPASPVLDSVVHLLSTMSVDYSSWAGAVLQNTSRPVFDNKKQTMKKMFFVLLWKLFKKTKIKHYLYLPPSVQLHLTTASHLVLHHWWWSPSQGTMWSPCHHVLLVGSPLLCWMLHFHLQWASLAVWQQVPPWFVLCF